MLHVALSTLACPGLTLCRAAALAREWDFDGLELRTFGPGSTSLASDPCLSDPLKVRRELDGAGLSLTGYGAGDRFDEPLTPPAPAGYVFGDFERPVRAFKPVLEHASVAGAGYVRVFGFERQGGEPVKRVSKRIADRLKLVCDDARNQGVRVALENGGSFATAEAVMEIVGRVGSPLLGVSYNLGPATDAGEDAATVVRELGDHLITARLTDRAGGVPCAAGDGELPCEPFVLALDTLDRDVPLVIEWPAMWRDDIPPADEAVPASFAAVSRWAGSAEPVGVV